MLQSRRGTHERHGAGVIAERRRSRALLEAICDLDLVSIAEIDPPRGYGRD